MPGNRPAIIRLYRLIHINNIEFVLKNGIYTRQSPMFDAQYIDIGDSNLIAQRDSQAISIKGYGTLGEYIPFYFAGHSPMLLNIKTGYRGIKKRPQHELAYIVCRLDSILTWCSEWVFTDGHARDRLSRYFSDITDLNEIDWNVVGDQYWRNTEDDFDRQRRKQAEFLVRNHVPAACIEKIVARDQPKKQTIEEIVRRLHLTIKVEADTHNRLFYP